MTLRGKAAIVGIGELPTREFYEGRSRSRFGVYAEAAQLAIADAGLEKTDIDGLIVEGGTSPPAVVADYLGMSPTFTIGVEMAGASGAASIGIAASAIATGLATSVLAVLGAVREPPQQGRGGGYQGGGGGGGAGSIGAEFEQPFGPSVGANTGYGMMYTRHMHKYGTKPEQMAKLAASQRFNALTNENAVFHGQPITPEDVLNSRYVNWPLHLLELVMPCSGAAACIVTSAERARSLPHRPAFLLGWGINVGKNHGWQNEDITVTPAAVTAPKAFEMSGYKPSDMQFLEMYDCYTILEAMSIEDAGFVKKGEVGPFFESTDTTYKGTLPINTDGGQLSGGQPWLAGGFRHVIEATRQIQGCASERQVARNDLCFVNGNGGGWGGEMCSLVLGSEATL